MLTIVILSDTHGMHERVEVPGGDVLIHAGDSSNGGSAADLRRLDAWLARLPHPHKLVVPGNMDGIGIEPRLHAGEERLLECGQLLVDGMVTILGVRFYGSPWTPRFVGGFQLNNEAEARAVWDRIPDNVEVLITHGPPAGVLDRTSTGLHVGDRVLRDRVAQLRPRVHAFGHVHESYGRQMGEGELAGITFLNAAVYNGERPHVIRLEVSPKTEALESRIRRR